VRLSGALTGLLCAVLVAAGAAVPPSAAAARPLPSYLQLGGEVRQLVTVTSDRWSDTRARLSVWERAAGGDWQRVRGPVRVRLGWNGWVPAGKRRQNTGTTPAGSFSMERAFGTRPSPGTALDYRHVDRDDVWPYEPRDPATYNILQPRRAAGSHWRADYHERLRSYGYEYAYAVVLGFNLPEDVRWSPQRRQYVAGEPADTRRGGGIFLHVQRSTYTAGCVAGPIDDIRWIVRRLDPSASPRIVMGPTHWVKTTRLRSTG
jgi:L,D-peptidoglycan transpeptidase YkuD (ErfK/YbiS/YcfS/YnhG family)